MAASCSASPAAARRIRWNDPTDDYCDLESTLATDLIRWTAPCFHHAAEGGAWCLAEGVRKIGVSLAICANALVADRKARALCVRNDGERGDAGLRLEHVSEFQSRRMRLPQLGGARVVAVDPQGPADQAGLQVGDVVMEFDGTQVINAAQLTLLITKAEPGRRRNVSVFRDGATLALPLVLAPAPGPSR